ncbi:CLUMA_CG003411, isoform A [Clunio marinus]|uniref:CLUMA_CG003411, isoform A n=1 Tax=Clunio marinus TaxID=568069 RepID=A0A1J1HR60_9DIPT|nr:CLUMA_CG003411, isoform A [Clunio marinus]
MKKIRLTKPFQTLIPSNWILWRLKASSENRSLKLLNEAEFNFPQVMLQLGSDVGFGWLNGKKSTIRNGIWCLWESCSLRHAAH